MWFCDKAVVAIAAGKCSVMSPNSSWCIQYNETWSCSWTGQTRFVSIFNIEAVSDIRIFHFMQLLARCENRQGFNHVTYHGFKWVQSEWNCVILIVHTMILLCWLDIRFLSVHPGRQITPLLLFLRFFPFFPVKGVFGGFFPDLNRGSKDRGTDCETSLRFVILGCINKTDLT